MKSTRRFVVLVLLAASCSNTTRVEVMLHVPAGDKPLATADSVSATVRDSGGATLAFARFAASTGAITLPPVTVGSGYTVELQASAGQDVVARGRSCPFDVNGTAATNVGVWLSRVGRFAPTAGPQLDRSGAAIFALDGDSVIAGGTARGSATSSSERYFTSAARFEPAAALVTPRSGALAVSSTSDAVLILGGAASDAIGVDVFSTANSLPEAVAFPADLVAAAGVRLGDGSILVAGGRRADGSVHGEAFVLSSDGASVDNVGALVSPRADYTLTIAGHDNFSAAFAIGGRDDNGPIADIEIYDPSTFTFAPAAAQLVTPRYDHTTTLLPSGVLLIVGGFDAGGAPIASAEIFDPVTRAVRAIGTAPIARAQHSATLLPSGQVLIAGGTDGKGPIVDAELFDVGLGSEGDFIPTASLSQARAGHAVVPLCDGTFLVAGGGTGAEIYNPF
jgi:large repetitive protein